MKRNAGEKYYLAGDDEKESSANASEDIVVKDCQIELVNMVI